MAPLAASLARSESKAKLLQRIGLDENNKVHRHLYSKMKAEASEGWQRMISNRDALIDSLRDDAAVAPPYTYGQIKEAAMRAEVARIYERACPETRIMYNLAHDGDAALVADNWIIRWLLWHVFRYRDDRNGVVHRQRSHFQAVAFRPRLPGQAVVVAEGDEEEEEDGRKEEEEDEVERRQRQQQVVVVNAVAAPKRTASQPILASPQLLAAVASSPRKQYVGGGGGGKAKYWDPVRDAYRDK